MNRRFTARLGLCLASTLCLVGALSTPCLQAEAATRYVGRPLAEALDELRNGGLDIAYSDRLVTPEMRVEEEPRAREPRQILDQVLRPHGLAVRETEDGTLVVVRVAVRAEAGPRDPDRLIEDRIEVTAKMSLLRREAGAGLTLEGSEIRHLPHFGDDLYRVLAVLPGVASNDATAPFSVRGGPHREVRVELDGFELFEPFHLKDLQGVFSILDPRVIGGADLFAGAFPARFGDRLSGVLDLTSRRPEARLRSLGISFSNAWIQGAGTLREGRGGWLASARRGYLDLVLEFVDEAGDDREPRPRYWDAFGKVEWNLGARPEASAQTLALHLVAAADTLVFRERKLRERTDVDTSYGNANLWLRHQALVGGEATVGTLLSAARIDRDRFGAHFEVDDEAFDAFDDRELEIAGLKQEWSWQPAVRQLLEGGFEARRYRATYDYANQVEIESPFADLRFLPPVGRTALDQVVQGNSYGAFVSDRLRAGRRWTLEAGARWDRQTWPGSSGGGQPGDGDQISPRLHLAGEVAPGTVLRLGWGLHYQSQRPHELDVQDGQTSFFEAERAELATAGLERVGRRGTVLRLDLYHRSVDDPRPRFENLFQPLRPFPETAADRIVVAAERSRARGLEIFLRSRPGRRFAGWLSYALSEVEDRVPEVPGAPATGDPDSFRWQPRFNDQTHALTVNGSYRPGPLWAFDALWTWRTGWPTTDIRGELVLGPDGTSRVVAVAGPFYAERFTAYHRLDVRVSRRIDLARRGALTWFLDVQNLYDRENPRGFDVDDNSFLVRDGEVVFDPDREHWLGVVPSFGVTWELP